jgi:hypothetical protein
VKVTVPVPPVEDAVQLTAVPTVPVDGQFIVTLNGGGPELTVIVSLFDVSWILDIVPSVPMAKAWYPPAGLAEMYWWDTVVLLAPPCVSAIVPVPEEPSPNFTKRAMLADRREPGTVLA